VLPYPTSLRELSADGRLLFLTRLLRLFAYGLLSVALVLYLAARGLSEVQIGLLLTFTLLGDTAVSLWLTTNADRLGRRLVLLVGAALMALGGLAFALTDNVALLMVAATFGVISPTGNEVGPFLSVEQAALTQAAPDRQRTAVFAWYNLVGSFATAIGALAGGVLAQLLLDAGQLAVDSYRANVLAYAALGVGLGLLFSRLSPAVEVPPSGRPTTGAGRLGLHRSRGIVLRLSSLFALDAFAGGFIVQSIIAFWFYRRFGAEPATLGGIIFGMNLLAGVSALAAARVAARIGLIRTMVYTHIPSNALLMLVPLMPTLPLAIFFLLLRSTISQMDVPTRQSYVMAVVSADERSAAAGITGVARTVGAGLAPMLVGPLLANPALLGAPFLLAGGLKIIYDLLVYRGFRALPPPEEQA
jgi:MFS family permease